MSKTKGELNKLKEEVEAVNEKLQKLTPEELEQVNGGVNPLKLPTGARVKVKDAADILAEQDIASRAAKERCDVLVGLN